MADEGACPPQGTAGARARPAWEAIRGKTSGLGSAHSPTQPSTRSKYHVFEYVMPS